MVGVGDWSLQYRTIYKQSIIQLVSSSLLTRGPRHLEQVFRGWPLSSPAALNSAISGLKMFVGIHDTSGPL